jgi:hypothetical protein
MIKRKILLIAALTALALGSNYGAKAQEGSPMEASTPASSDAIRSATVLTVHAKIAEVNKSEKLVVLQGPAGRFTVRVENPYNLDAAKVGEPVITRYYEVVTIRKKKPSESIPSASLKGGIATARPGGLPGAVAEEHVALLVTVVSIDEAKGTVTVKAPDGTVEQVKAKYPRNLKRIKTGDELVVALSRAIAISLEKEPAS